MKRKHGLLFFISSCIPGCGQMHQGYMKRGMSLLLAFCGVFALAIFLEIAAVAAFLPVVWLYAFFDSYNLRTQLDSGTAPEDAFLFGLSEMDSQKLAELCQKRHSLIGWLLVALGVYMLYDIVMRRVLWFLWDWPIIGSLIHALPRLVVTLVVIALGLWFIRGPKAPQAPAEDIPSFTPPAEAEKEVPHDGAQ